MSLKKVYRFCRTSTLLLWGRQWKWRSRFISAQQVREANEALKARQKNMFFVLGSGRSGTQLVTGLLGLGGSSLILHEPNFNEDVATMEAFRRSPEACRHYWESFRQVEVHRRWAAAPEAVRYGEVNGTIRYHAPAIQALFPESPVLLVARDGRGVVRSVMGWPQFYGRGSKGAYALQPLPDDRFAAEWEGMSRFEKICWGWQETNESIMRHIGPEGWLQLEKLVSDYDYFTERLCARLGFEVSREVWAAYTSKPSRNATDAYAFPAWDDWTSEQQHQFKRICGDTMSRLGFEF